MSLNRVFRRLSLLRNSWTNSMIVICNNSSKSTDKKVSTNGETIESNVEQNKVFRKSCNQSDIYGDVDPISNMPNIKFLIPENETDKEKQFREFKQELLTWHQQFWLKHNERFRKEKKAHLNQRRHPNIADEKMQADDLSIFYKDFLDRNFKIHLDYQREWYKKNFQCLWYGLQVSLEKLFSSKKSRVNK